ncbi:hypothetical protein ACFC08_33645 [Streptomyces sp. NPDC056112]|uniref:hypothetical protein n=1 Tax=Streptomyces sp. NPDC056112 TaxID=3345715 RepID=UPI0035D625D1
MRQRLLYALAAAPGIALFFGAALLGAWADDHRHIWLSRACIMGVSVGLVVVGGSILLAITPRAWRRFVFPRWPEGQDGLFDRRMKLPDDWRR